MKHRLWVKTCTYAIMHFVVAICVAFALTRDLQLALAVGVVEPLVQTVAFAVHERVWGARAHNDPKPADACGHTALAGLLVKPKRS